MPSPTRRATPGLRAAGLLVCAALGTSSPGCTSFPGEIEEWLRSPVQPRAELPELREGDAAGLAAPQGLRATSGELREIPLRWDPLLEEDVAGYALERAPEREGPFARVAAVPGATATVYVDRGSPPPGVRRRGAYLEDGVTLFYRVRAFRRDGELGATSEVVAATTAPLPDEPGQLRAWSHRPREVPLAWEPSPEPHVTGYVVERSPVAEGPYTEIARIEDRWQSTWVDRGLGDLRVFYYRVAAFTEAGARGPEAEPVRAVTKPEPLPPIGLRVTEQRLGENRLAWEPNVEPDLTGYRLLRTRERNGEPEPVARLGIEVAAVDREVGAGERVAYQLVAVDRDGLESPRSEPVSVASEGYGLTATLREDGVHLAWQPRGDEGWARARVFLDGMVSSRELAVVTEPAFVHTDARPGRRYRYRVVLETADGRPAPTSEPVEIRVPEG
ncbi:MAG: hypothetical protein QNK04_26990 [Myxococcota bacterium]|nr:hypothetical protein [Myxococcota bacterium]